MSSGVMPSIRVCSEFRSFSCGLLIVDQCCKCEIYGTLCDTVAL